MIRHDKAMVVPSPRIAERNKSIYGLGGEAGGEDVVEPPSAPAGGGLREAGDLCPPSDMGEVRWPGEGELLAAAPGFGPTT